MQVRFDKLNILAGKCSLGDKNIPATTRTLQLAAVRGNCTMAAKIVWNFYM